MQIELSDDEVFGRGGPKELSDAEVFGTGQPIDGGGVSGVLDRVVVRPAKAVWSGFQGGGGNIAHALGNASELLDRAYGGGEASPDNAITNFFRGMEGRYRARAQEAMPSDPTLAEKLYAAIGQAPVDMAGILPAVAAAGPVGGMALYGGLSKADQGLVPAAEGAFEGALAGKLMHGLAPYALPTRVVGNAAFGGAQAAADPNADATDIAASALLMGGMGAPGNGRVRFRDRNEMPRRPDMLTPEETAAMGVLPTDARDLQSRGASVEFVDRVAPQARGGMLDNNMGDVLDRAVRGDADARAQFTHFLAADPQVATRMLTDAGVPENVIRQFAPGLATSLARGESSIPDAVEAAQAFELARRKQEAGVYQEQPYARERVVDGRVVEREQVPTGRRVVETTERDRGSVAQPAVQVGSGQGGALVPVEPRPEPMTDTQINIARAQMEQPGRRSSDAAMYVNRAGEVGGMGEVAPEFTGLALPSPEGASRLPMTEQQVEVARAQMGGGNVNAAEGLPRAVAPEGGLPRTPDQVLQDRQAQGAFDLASRQNERAGSTVRDTQTAGRPSGPNQQRVYLDEGFPVEVLSVRVEKVGKTYEEVATVRRYDPRTGQPVEGAPEYTVPTRKLREKNYAADPRQAQDVAERSVGPGNPEQPRMATRHDVRYEPDQTYRTTSPDPTVPGAGGPTSEFPGRGPSPRSPRPEQPPGSGSWRDSPAGEEAVFREWERRAREDAKREKDNQRARNRTNNQYKSESVFTNEPGNAGADGFWSVNPDGMLTDSNGRVVKFETAKDAAVWAARNGQGAYFDRVVVRSNSDEVYLRATENYHRDKAAAGAQKQEAPKAEAPEAPAPDAQPVRPEPVRELSPPPKAEEPVRPEPAPAAGAWGPNPDLPPLTGKGEPRKLTTDTQPPKSEEAIWGRMADNDQRRLEPKLDKAQKAAAEDAKQETLNRFETAKADVSGRWENRADRALTSAVAAQKFTGSNGPSNRAKFKSGWRDTMMDKVDADRTDTTRSYRYDSNYAAGVRAAREFLVNNPAPEQLGGPVRVQGVTARGKGATYEINPTEASIESVKTSVSKLPLNRFYTNPLDPAAIKQFLVDPAVRAVRNLVQKEVEGFQRGMRGMKATDADLKSPNRLTIGEAVRNHARFWFRSNRAHFTALEARYRDSSPAGADAIRQLGDLIGSAPGSGRVVRQGFDEAVRERGRGMMSRLHNVLQGHLDDPAFMDAVHDALAGVRTPSDPRVRAVADRVRKLLDEQRDYLVSNGIEVGQRQNYFPRIVSEAKVMADPSGFNTAAEAAYRANGLDPATAKDAAETWFHRVMGIGADEYGTGIGSRHTQGRALGDPRTDAIMKDYYETDVVSALTSYFHQTSRLAEFTARFGKSGERVTELLDTMRKEGVKEPDVASLEKAWESSVGRVSTSLPDSLLGLSQWASTMTNVALLPRSVLASVMEPLTAGIRTGNAMDGLRAFQDTIKSVVKSRDMVEARELAEGLGIVGEAAQQMVLAARWGGGLSDRHGIVVRGHKITPARVNAMFFEKIGLSGLTEHQRVSTTKLAQGYVASLLRHIDTPAKAASAKSLLADLGMTDAEARTVRNWLNKNPSGQDIITSTAPEARMYRAALGRFVDEVVMEPKGYDRPTLANMPVARLMYGISSFNYAYWNNVMVRFWRQLKDGVSGKSRMGEDLTARERVSMAAGPVAAWMILAAGQVMVSNLRDMVFNPSAADERKKEPIRGHLAHADRAGFFGAASPYVNSVLSVRYERDLANMFIGPGVGYALQNTQKMIGLLPEPLGKNSENTNTAEWNASQAAYRLASPFATAALAVVPGGPVLNTLAGATIMGVSSPEASTQFANAVAGEKTKGRGGSNRPRTYTR